MVALQDLENLSIDKKALDEVRQYHQSLVGHSDADRKIVEFENISPDGATIEAVLYKC